MKKLLFALLLSCVAATASAACQKFNPDGTIEQCQHIAPGEPLNAPAPEQASANPCQLGGMLDIKKAGHTLQGLVELLGG